MAPRIVNLGNRWRWVVSFTSWCSLDGWAPELVWVR